MSLPKTDPSYIRDQGHVRVKYRPESTDGKRQRARTIYLVNPVETNFLNGKVLVGMQVKKDGEKMDRQHVIDIGLIEETTPMVMNMFYGKLEPRS